jgi:hypothetical protein
LHLSLRGQPAAAGRRPSGGMTARSRAGGSRDRRTGATVSKILPPEKQPRPACDLTPQLARPRPDGRGSASRFCSLQVPYSKIQPGEWKCRRALMSSRYPCSGVITFPSTRLRSCDRISLRVAARNAYSPPPSTSGRKISLCVVMVRLQVSPAFLPRVFFPGAAGVSPPHEPPPLRGKCQTTPLPLSGADRLHRSLRGKPAAAGHHAG